jgi:hypothetical protein
VPGELDATAARQGDQLLLAAGVLTPVLGMSSTLPGRGWAVLTADPGRLRRVDPDVQFDLL